MSLTKAEQLPDALSGITGLKLYHLFKPATIKAPYAVWQEDSEGQSFYASNRKQEQVLELTLDYFTQTEYDPVADNIQDALDKTWDCPCHASRFSIDGDIIYGPSVYSIKIDK